MSLLGFALPWAASSRPWIGGLTNLAASPQLPARARATLRKEEAAAGHFGFY